MATAADEANQIRSTFAATVNQIRADQTISQPEKNKRLAKAWVQMKDAMTSLADATDEVAKTRRSELERTLYGIPNPSDASAAISYRDALDRATALDFYDEPSAIALMNRAETSGDTALARALLATAYQRQWVDVINTYRRAHDNLSDNIHELWDLNNSGPQGADMFTFTPLSVPRELSQTQARDIQAMAAGE